MIEKSTLAWETNTPNRLWQLVRHNSSHL